MSDVFVFSGLTAWYKLLCNRC